MEQALYAPARGQTLPSAHLAVIVTIQPLLVVLLVRLGLSGDDLARLRLGVKLFLTLAVELVGLTVLYQIDPAMSNLFQVLVLVVPPVVDLDHKL